MNKELRRETVLISFFGALWGVMEITLGVFLKGMRVPFGGEILTAGAALIALTGRYFIRQKCSIALMGIVAAIIKLFSLGNVILGPFTAIIMEGITAEIIISLFGINFFSFCFAGAVIQVYTLIHPFFAQGLIYGADIYKMYGELITSAGNILNLENSGLWVILAAWGGLHIIIGLIAGWLSWRLSKKVESELNKKS
jgi:hypothetical protein